jgi:hypothetical protein
VIDGNNLLHALVGGVDASALREFLARLRATLPTGVMGTIVLDGPPDPGAPMRARVGTEILVRHAGRSGADRVIVETVEALPLVARGGVVVITNDLELRGRVAHAGARAEPVAWLIERLGSRPLDVPAAKPSRPVSPGQWPRPRLGAAHPVQGPGPDLRRRTRAVMPSDWEALGPSGPAPRDPSHGPAGAADVGGWHPGRGATRKHGNPRRLPRRRGKPPTP